MMDVVDREGAGARAGVKQVSERRFSHPPTSPLSETASRLSALDEFLNIQVGMPQGDDWHGLRDLSDARLLAGWHIDLAERLDDRRVAASYMSNWLIAVAAGIWVMPVVADSRLPLASHGDVAIRRNEGGWFDGVVVADDAVALLPGDPAVGYSGAVTLPDRGALFDALAGRLLALAPIVDALSDACPIGPPALWGGWRTPSPARRSGWLA